MSYLSAFSLTRDPLLFQKNPCHLVAKGAIFNVSFQFRTILLCVSFTKQRPICMYNNPLNSSLFGIKIEQQSFFFKQTKPFAEFTLLFATPVQRWHTYHKSYITCLDPHFLWVQSIISIIYKPWIHWKFVLDKNFLWVCDFFVRILLPHC